MPLGEQLIMYIPIFFRQLGMTWVNPILDFCI